MSKMGEVIIKDDKEKEIKAERDYLRFAMLKGTKEQEKETQQKLQTKKQNLEIQKYLSLQMSET